MFALPVSSCGLRSASYGEISSLAGDRGGGHRVGVAGGRGAGFGGGVLGGALGLDLGGVEAAVAAVGAHGEGLGVVLELVGRGLGAVIVDAESLIELDESEGGVGADPGDGTRLNVAGDAEVLAVDVGTLLLEFGDRVVVALCLAAGRDGEPDDD